MSTTYRVGLVGTGGIAKAHGNACQQAPSAELAAICDVSENALTNFGERFDVAPENQYLSLEEMLDAENLDIAIICTWGAFHAEVGIQLSESAKSKRFCVRSRSRQRLRRRKRSLVQHRRTGFWWRKRLSSGIIRCTSRRRS